MSDDSASTARFPKLNDGNYAEWSMMMEAELVRKGLWGMVEILVDTEGKEETAWKAELQMKMVKRTAQKMAEARAEMILRVEGGQLSHMRTCDPMEIWDHLRHVHRTHGFVTSLALRRKFLTAKKKSGQLMQSWIGEIQSQVFKIEEAGIVVTKQDKILALTMGLLDVYSPVIINFDSTAPDQLTFDHVVTHLLNEETRQALGTSTTPRSTCTKTDDGNEAMAMMPAPRGSRPRADVTCYFCSAKGHFKSECRECEKWEKQKVDEEANAAVDESSDSDTAW
ncbi:hypothetical protein EW146_g9647 [Bondarzewia mesenterica]|uniref:CCHC-type domain-containing protein n=1 Tax=Bondarzewia mesenterica TaxID=1095465 RepID=A0A4S4L6C0_9AGAM|nr:hypothetical protein EW146_g9647 [Bondarzewia mesenterica]